MSYFRFLILGGAALGLLACGGKNTPAPDTLLSEIITAHPVNLQKIAEGVWVHSSAYRFPGAALVPSNGLVVEDGDALILVDTAWGELATLALLAKIESEIGKPVKKLIVTHHHYDRLAGVDILEARGAEVFSHLRGADQKTLGNTATASIEDWASSLAWMSAVYKDAKFVVPGHGKGGDASLPRLTLRLLAATVNAQEAGGEETGDDNKPE